MKTHHHELGTVYVPGPNDSLDQLYRLHQAAPFWAADTETTGLNQYVADFRVRVVQVGSRDEAWVLRPEWHAADIFQLITGRETWWHSWLFDAISIEESLGFDFDVVAGAAHCTEILSRLLDPREVQKGGTGHKLELLAPAYLGTGSKKDAATALYEAWARPHKVKKNDMWPLLPVDLPEYELYAGQDVFLTARLAEVLTEKVRGRGQLQRFADFERPLSRRIASMQRIGMPFDHEWAGKAEAEYDEEFHAAETELLERWRIEQTATYAHTSKKALQARFEELGVKWTKRSPKTGAPSLDKDVIGDLAADRGDVGALARTISRAKVNKHYGDYIRIMRDQLGADGRVHPNVRPMQAATHRMSISNPPLQQFPRGDNRPRGCLLADEGDVILSADYAQVEFRIGAAVSGDPVIREKIRNGEDLHEVTAVALFGPGFTKDQRQASKPVGFGRLFLGSAKGIRQKMLESDTTGQVPSLTRVKMAIAAFDSQYRRYNRWAMRLKAKVENDNGRLITATGRELIVEHAYAAPNYMIQSTARDVFAAGINAIHRAGLGDMLRLVVHDEVVMSVPIARAGEIGHIVQEAMSTTFKGVEIETEWEIKGERWVK